MTKAELIEQLKEYPDDTIIVLTGRSDGFNDASEVSELWVRKTEPTLMLGKYLITNWRGQYVGATIQEPEQNKIKAIHIL